MEEMKTLLAHSGTSPPLFTLYIPAIKLTIAQIINIAKNVLLSPPLTLRTHTPAYAVILNNLLTG